MSLAQGILFSDLVPQYTMNWQSHSAELEVRHCFEVMYESRKSVPPFMWAVSTYGPMHAV